MGACSDCDDLSMQSFGPGPHTARIRSRFAAVIRTLTQYSSEIGYELMPWDGPGDGRRVAPEQLYEHCNCNCSGYGCGMGAASEGGGGRFGEDGIYLFAGCRADDAASSGVLCVCGVRSRLGGGLRAEVKLS